MSIQSKRDLDRGGCTCSNSKAKAVLIRVEMSSFWNGL